MTKAPLVCHWIEYDRDGKVVGRRFHRVTPEVVEAVAEVAAAKVVTRGVKPQAGKPDQARLL